MIAHLSGKILFKEATSVIIDAGGVGYEVTIPLSTYYELGELESAISLRIYTHVREDTLQLFGFKSSRERELFLLLLSVSGIGPKLAITTLSGMSADEIIGAIRTENLVRLNSIPGIGKKTAERLIIELRDKINSLSAMSAEEEIASKSATGESLSSNAIFDDALAALVSLGYAKPIADKALRTASQEGTEMSVQKLLRRSLQLLSKG